jgi:putative transposase
VAVALPPLAEILVMPRSYKVILDEGYAYFITCTVVEHAPLFQDPAYARIILDSLAYIREHKNTRLNAFVLMSTHLHAVLWPKYGINLSDVLRDFKRFTSRTISRLAHKCGDNRFLQTFASVCLSGRASKTSEYQVWQEGSHSEAIYSDNFTRQKIDYIHLNPVKAGLVSKAEDWMNSSARAYLLDKPTYPPIDILPLW